MASSSFQNDIFEIERVARSKGTSVYLSQMPLELALSEVAKLNWLTEVSIVYRDILPNAKETIYDSGQVIVTYYRDLCQDDLDRLVSLSPLSRLTSLKTLRLTGAAVKDLNCLSELKSLTSLTLRSCLVDDFNQLQSIPSLVKLDLSKTTFHHSKIFKSLENLEELRLQNCVFLRKLKSLKGCPRIRLIDASNCRMLRRVGGIKYLKRLKSLDLSGCIEFDDFDEFGFISGLISLDLGNCEKLINIDFVSSHKGLQHLNLQNCVEVQDLSPVSELTKLANLNLRNTKVEDLSPIQSHSCIQNLDCTGTNIVSLRPLRNLIRTGVEVYVDEQNAHNLPFAVQVQFGGFPKICISKCQCTDPPMNICNRGSSDILDYWWLGPKYLIVFFLRNAFAALCGIVSILIALYWTILWWVRLDPSIILSLPAMIYILIIVLPKPSISSLLWKRDRWLSFDNYTESKFPKINPGALIALVALWGIMIFSYMHEGIPEGYWVWTKELIPFLVFSITTVLYFLRIIRLEGRFDPFRIRRIFAKDCNGKVDNSLQIQASIRRNPLDPS